MNRDVFAGVTLLAMFAWAGWLFTTLDGMTWPTLWWIASSCFVFGYATCTWTRYATCTNGTHVMTLDRKRGTVTNRPTRRTLRRWRREGRRPPMWLPEA